MQSLDELCSLLTSLLVVALSEDVGCLDHNAVSAEICLQSINKYIKGIEIEELDIQEENLFDDFDSDKTPLSWQKWSDEMYAKANDIALQSQNGNVVNAFYNPTAAKKIKSLIEHLPLWTGIMRPYFKTGKKVATSSSVESIFAEYKTRLFKGCITMRVDKFVIRHLDYLDGRSRLDFAGNISSTEQELEISPNKDLLTVNISSNLDNSILASTPISDKNSFNVDRSISNNSYEIVENPSPKSPVPVISDASYTLSENTCPLNFEENWRERIKQKC